jgi:hypothetical protein
LIKAADRELYDRQVNKLNKQDSRSSLMNSITKPILASILSLVITAAANAGHSEGQHYNDKDSKNIINHRLDGTEYLSAHGLENHSFTYANSKALNKKCHEISNINRKNDLARYVSYHDKYAHKKDFRGVW